jgi:hypothetical protein
VADEIIYRINLGLPVIDMPTNLKAKQKLLIKDIRRELKKTTG